MRRLLTSFSAVLMLAACATASDGLDRLPAEAAQISASAREGVPEAMERVGEFFQQGVGVKRDMPTALLWYRRAADKGLASSQDYVGLFYAGGLGGLKEDCGEALRWFREAVRNGYGDSRNNEAWMLATCPEAKYRDGALALKIVRAVLDEQGPNATLMGTLAAAYAEVGDFEHAVEAEVDSLARMRIEQASADSIKESEACLASFRAHKPWRGVAFADPEFYKP